MKKYYLIESDIHDEGKIYINHRDFFLDILPNCIKIPESKFWLLISYKSIEDLKSFIEGKSLNKENFKLIEITKNNYFEIEKKLPLNLPDSISEKIEEVKRNFKLDELF
jgi:hypothetical protein